jgi:CRISPR-associated endonuclease Csn1
MKIRLGLDVGVASIGWCLIEIDDNGTPVKILSIGSRIVPLNTDDAKEFTSGNVMSKNRERTKRRTQRKGYDRYQLRRNRLTRSLGELGMLPDEYLIKLPVLELWQLRANAAKEGTKLTLPEIGRVLYHLNQKRGYKHAKSDMDADSKQKEYVNAVNERYATIKGLGQTIGQYFVGRLKESEFVNENGKKYYSYRIKAQVFPREAYVAEFHQIMESQRKFYPQVLTQEVIDELRDSIIYYQRGLKSCKHLVSLCDFEKQVIEKEDGKILYIGSKVAPRTSPLFQICKIWEAVNNITLKNRRGDELYISPEQRHLLFEHLDNHERLTLKDLHSILGINKNDGWWGGKAIGKGLQGNTTKMELKKALSKCQSSDVKELLTFDIKNVDTDNVDETTGEILQMISSEFKKEPLYKLWHTIYSIKDKEELFKVLKKNFKISDPATLQKLYSIDFVKQGYGNKSSKAMRRILPYLQEGLKYNDACEYVGFKHSDSLTTIENEARPLLNRLPSIEKNELRQPVVEKILNQMINIVNALIDEYQKIDEINIELARELKQSKDERNATETNYRQRERENNAIGKKITEEGIRSTRNNIRKYRLWEEAAQKCFYCGKAVNVKNFLLSLDTEREHIIPKGLLFDDSYSNQVCSCQECNSQKSMRTAYDYMHTKSDKEFGDYLDRVEKYYKEKRISKTKREHLLASYTGYSERKRKGEETEQDKLLWEQFIDRQLRQSQYIASKAQEILKQVCRNVMPTTGSVTDFVRHTWGYDKILHKLNFNRYRDARMTEWVVYEHKGQQHQEERIVNWSKRLDNRHHAIDALTIACTNRSMIQRLNTLNAMRDEMFAGIEKQSDDWRNRYSLLEAWLLNQKHIPVSVVEAVIKSVLISIKPGKKVATYGKRKVFIKGARVTIQKNIIIPRGPLHADSLYGSIEQYVKGKEPTNRIVRKYTLGIGAQGFLFTGKETYEKEDSSKGKKEKNQIKKILDSIVDKKVRDIILKRLNRGFPKEQDYKSDTKKALNNLRDLDNDPLYSDKAKKMIVKSVRCFTNSTSALSIRYNSDGKPISFVEPENNHHIALYTDAKGVMHEHIVSFWHAVERKQYGIPIIIDNPNDVWNAILDKQEYPDAFLRNLPEDDWHFDMSLQQNEMFILGMEEQTYRDAMQSGDYAILGEHLYYVQNISEKQYRFTRHIESKFDVKDMNKPDKRFYNIASIGALYHLNPHKVTVSLLGKIKEYE